MVGNGGIYFGFQFLVELELLEPELELDEEDDEEEDEDELEELLEDVSFFAASLYPLDR
jgi:hypothetical protein